jgi:hypothetical protein
MDIAPTGPATPRGSGVGAHATTRSPIPPADGRPGAPPRRRLLDQVRDAVRLRHYSIRTEEAYVGWVRRFVLFHHKKHPAEMGAVEVRDFSPRSHAIGTSPRRPRITPSTRSSFYTMPFCVGRSVTWTRSNAPSDPYGCPSY